MAVADEFVDLEEVEELDEEVGPPSRLATWLILFGLGALLVPLALVMLTIKQDNDTLQADMDQLQQTIDSQSAVGPDEQAAQDEILALREQVRALESAQTTLDDSYVDWPVVMTVIGNYHQGEMALTSVAQTDSLTLILKGEAGAEAIVMSYAAMLEDSGRFERVVVQSILLRPPATPTPGPAQPTATPPAEAALSPTPTTAAPVVEFTVLAAIAHEEVSHE